MNQFTSILCAIGVPGAFALASGAAAMPNVILFLVDDLDYPYGLIGETAAGFSCA